MKLQNELPIDHRLATVYRYGATVCGLILAGFGCLGFADRLDGFRRVVNASRAVAAEDMPATPPRKVWDALIADVTGGGGDEALSRTGQGTPPAAPKRARYSPAHGRLQWQR